MASSLLELPEDVWRHISANLATPDLLHFLSSHRRLHEGLGRSPAFWKFLLQEDEETIIGSSPRDKYMLQAYRRHLPAVQWYPVQRLYNAGVSPREGHIACVFSTPTEERICITGGFTDDSTVYLCQVPSTAHPSSTTRSSRDEEQRSSTWTWSRLHPSGPRTFVYGSTLTTLDETRAIRFGGFLSGGYSAETNDVALLTVEEQAGQPNRFSAQWRVIPTQNPQFGVGRAYHTATLLAGRYLLILGGMTGSGCIVSEAILDTQTWTWLDPSRIMSGAALSSGDYRPSGRHGHSVILDDRRNRLLLFGGGSGTDLLRSGKDNAEVWQLQMRDGWATDLEASFPWTWKKIHGEILVDGEEKEEEADGGEGRENSQGEGSSVASQPMLTPAETLCLGRCHNGVKVSPDAALLLFGSGKPSTNAVLAFDLRNNIFMRPKILGPLPKPRFTFASAFLQRQGYILVHGGYSSQEGDAIGDMTVLDLAPFVHNREFSGLSVDRNARCYGAVTNDDARRGRMGRDTFMQYMFETLGGVADNQRQGMAAEMLGQMIANGQYGGRSFALMNMIANGSMVLRVGSEDDDDEDDPDYQEESDDEMGGL